MIAATAPASPPDSVTPEGTVSAPKRATSVTLLSCCATLAPSAAAVSTVKTFAPGSMAETVPKPNEPLALLYSRNWSPVWTHGIGTELVTIAVRSDAETVAAA